MSTETYYNQVSTERRQAAGLTDQTDDIAASNLAYTDAKENHLSP